MTDSSKSMSTRHS